MAVLVDIAGHGLPSWFWSVAADREPTVSALEYGRRRALREQGSFSYRNAFIAELDGEVAGMLTGYRQPDSISADGADELHPALRPLAELEAHAQGTWYVNVLAVFEEFRKRGVGSALLRKAEELAAESAATGLSVIVESGNAEAMSLYERQSYKGRASKPFVPFPGCAHADSWILMVKPLAAAG